MRNNELAGAWLKRAVSSLEKTKIGKISEALFYEDLCFDCQQAVEKEPVNAEEYLEAVELAAKVVQRVGEQLKERC